MGASFPEAKVELGRQCDRHTHSSLRVCKAPLPPHQARGAPGFRWLYRRGPTRSHPEHGSQALQSRWYCTLCVWESRSLPEFFPDAPPLTTSRGASLFAELVEAPDYKINAEARRRGDLFQTNPPRLRDSAFVFEPTAARSAAGSVGGVFVEGAGGAEVDQDGLARDHAER